MKVLMDTSIFYPAITIGHPNHQKCKAFLAHLHGNNEITVLNTHLIAELYGNLTRTPKLKMAPKDARDAIHHLVEMYDSVELTTDDYLAAIDRCAKFNLESGVIFDALHFQAAIKANVDVLYTANLRDFARLTSEEVTFELKAPY